MNIRIVGISTAAITMFVLLLVLYCLSGTAWASEGDAHEHEHESGISLLSFIEPLGIGALSCVLVTFVTGLFRRKLGKRFLRVHKTFAWLAVGLALCHGILVRVLF